MTRISWPVAVVSLGFLTLVGVIFWRASADMNQFPVLWQAAGPILGVVVGAIPGAIFGVSAQQGQTRAQKRAEVYALHTPEEQAAAATDALPKES